MPLPTVPSLLDRLTTPRVLVLLFVVYLLFPTVLSPYFPPEGIRPLDLFFSYSPAEAYAIISSYGEDGRNAYAWVELTLDIAYPAIYSLLLSIALNFVCRASLRPQSPFRLLRFLPFVVAAIDVLENLAIVSLLAEYPRRIDALAAAASLFTSAKWILAGACLLLLLSGSLFCLARRLSGKPVKARLGEG